MNELKCSCGRTIPQQRNSTIQNKKCPKCTLLATQAKKTYHRTTIYGKTPQDTTERKPHLKTAKKLSFDFYKTTAWNWCRKYVLLYYSGPDGTVKCCTSGKIMSIATANCHCGHYIKVREGNSTNYATAFDFRNMGPQTRKDNTFMGGRQDLMREWLVKQHGEDEIKALEAQRHTIYKLDKYELDKWAEYYRNKFNDLLKERGLMNPWGKGGKNTM